MYILKNFKNLIFYFFYGKIKKTIKAKNSLSVKLVKIILEKKYSYNIFEIRNSILYNGSVHDCAIIADNRIIKEPSYQYRQNKNKDVINGKISKNISLKVGTPKIRKKISSTVFSMLSGGAGKNNYFHWLFDVLPRIAILENYNNRKPDYYLVPSLKYAYQIETLKKMNIPFSKILDGEKNKHLLCNKLIVVDHPYVFKNNPTKSILNIPKWIIKWLQTKFKISNQKKKKFPLKIFIDRSDSPYFKTRYMINDKEIKSILIDMGFKIVTLSKLTFEKQIRIFQNAKTIVGLHGAGFANIIFSKAGTKIVEIQSTTSGNVIKNLAKTCNLNYKKISIKSKNKDLTNQHGNILVDINKLKKSILSK
ncbi:glycosyltransferase family 61 protein [Pelagibacteraceae bacterium]|nr:glycosyltransferase family 61 protein [Pelagibacteraceae bacterium]